MPKKITDDPRVTAHLQRLADAAPKFTAEQVDGLRRLWFGHEQTSVGILPTPADGGTR